MISQKSCALCGADGGIRESHIIPAFVWRWMRETSATGHFRLGESPNLRAQDGFTTPLLCEDCEKRFSVWEKAFSEQVFVPVQQGSNEEIPYDRWLLLFAVSVSWRVAVYLYRLEGFSDFPDEELAYAKKALDRWAKFLLGQSETPGEFEQHLIVLDAIDRSTTPDLPANISRYLRRAIEIDVAHAVTQSIVYTKMMRLLVVGFIHMPRPRRWINTKVNLKRGTIGGPRNYEVPGNFGDFLMQKAREAQELHGKLSDKQKRKIQSDFMVNIDRAMESDVFEAMRHDVRLFGSRAFDED